MTKKQIELTKTILTWSVVGIAALMVIFTIFSLTSLNKYERNIFGWKFFIVTSDSMRKTDFDAGDLIFVKQVKDPSTLEAGDIISYRSYDVKNYGGIVTHKIRRTTVDIYGNPGFITYGTTTDTDDAAIVLYKDVLGQYKGKIPNLGYFFNFLRTPVGYIFCIFAPFAVLIALQGIEALQAFRTHKKTERELLDEEWAKLAEERKAYEKEIKDLKKMIKFLENSLSENESSDK